MKKIFFPLPGLEAQFLGRFYRPCLHGKIEISHTTHLPIRCKNAKRVDTTLHP
jgi:hypothetical protein